MIQNSKLKIQNLGPTLIVVALLFIVFFLSFGSMRNFSPTVDEVTHLPSGYSYLKTREIKLNPEHPPLVKMLAALPLLFMNIKFNPDDPTLGNSSQEWVFGRNFLAENGVDRIIFWGRIPIILLSVLLGWYVYKWGSELFGRRAGLIGLLIYTFMPNIIAHAQLVTTDLGLAAFSFIAFYYLWKLLKSDFNRRYLIYSGIFLGLALGSKFSAVFLLPLFFLLLTVYIWEKHTRFNWLLKTNSLLKIILPIYGLSFLIIWGLYFFPADPLFYWNDLNTVYVKINPGYYHYLNGVFNQDDWWYYFLWAFIIKTPIPFLIGLLLAIVNYRKVRLNFLNSSFIFLPVALFLVITSWKARNIGIRYILPIYPFLILFVSGYIEKLIQNAKIKLQNDNAKFKNLSRLSGIPKFYILIFTFFILCIWYVFSAIKVYPDYLAYFNELVGGPNNGYKYLDDSNIDWGQDLKRLAQYQNKNPDLQVVYVWDSYVNAARLYGIKNILSLDSEELWLNPKGKYAVSTHAVIRTKLASQLTKNDKMNWMDNYKPIDRIGQSFFIYEFP